ncbi:hypothetical protein BY458DRAFT_532887 [Sporodiniella umbellata]|nr:hypothetical protein BY458DRAFT_532887 [Sporodiniella umbellata]
MWVTRFLFLSFLPTFFSAPTRISPHYALDTLYLVDQAIVQSWITWIMLANFEPLSSYGSNRLTIYLVVPLIVGLVSICFMFVTIQLYLMLLGGLGGVAFGLWILGWKDNLSITSVYGRAILLTVLAVLLMLGSLYHHSLHKLGAALTGAYLFFMGLDVYVHTGFLYCFTTTLDTNHRNPGILYQHRVCMSTYTANPEYNTKGSVRRSFFPSAYPANWRFWARPAQPPPPPPPP